jgi:hypothetical protein
MSQSYDNKGQVALWPNEKYESGGPHPRFKGNVIAPRDIKAGEQLDIAVWDGNSENPKAPALKGKVSDKFTPEASAPAGTQASDSVPF